MVVEETGLRRLDVIVIPYDIPHTCDACCTLSNLVGDERSRQEG